jgi:tetratricopeptide (TPR) repeat protein
VAGWVQPSSCATWDTRLMLFSCAHPPFALILPQQLMLLSSHHPRYNEALELEPSNARAYYSFGNLYLDAGDHARALPLCDKLFTA